MAWLNMHEKAVTNVQALVDSFESFKHCGPSSAAAVRLHGSDKPVEMLHSGSDWSHITKGRPVEDCRIADLRDLIPSPREVLREMHGSSQKQSAPFVSMR
jgi:hypothetical protein